VLPGGSAGVLLDVLLRRVAAFAIVVVVALAGGSFAGGYQRPGVTYRVSVGAHGAQGNGSSGSPQVTGFGVQQTAMTPDARYVAFASDASNLVGGDTDRVTDVFVRDRAAGTTERVSIATGGAEGLTATCRQGAWGPSISANGRYVVFSSCFPNLVPGTVYVGTQVFRRDRKTGVTSLVSVDNSGHPASFGVAGEPMATVSADGRYVAFETDAVNLIGNCPIESPLGPVPVASPFVCPHLQVVVRDVVAKTTQLISAAADGSIADDVSEYPSISPDGGYVAFASYADNLSPANTNLPCELSPLLSLGYHACQKVFLRDRIRRTTELVSVGLNGEPPDNMSANAGWNAQAVSSGGRYVVFDSSATNLIPVVTNSGIYVRDMHTGRTTNVAVDSSGQQWGGGGVGTAISSTGRYVVYGANQIGCPLSNPTCTTPCPAKYGEYVVYDLVTGASEPGCAQANSQQQYAWQPLITADGRFVEFIGEAGNLVPGDTNATSDVFVRDRGPALGVGGLSLAGVPGFKASGVVSLAADPTPILAGASLAYRPASADLFLRLDVRHMATAAAGSAGLVYGADLTVDGTRYEVRIAATGPAASYGLFEQTRTGGWAQVAKLRGGFGTTGEEAVAAVPLAFIGARAGTRLSGLRAFAGVGSYELGVTTQDHRALYRPDPAQETS